MNLLTYLGAKKDKFTLPYKDDLLSYLLGKKASKPQVQTASGTTLEITAKKKNIVELTLDHMCEQTGTPTPDNPVPVVVAEGYRNLLNYNSEYIKRNNNVSVSVNNNQITLSNSSVFGNTAIAYFIPIEIGKRMTVSYNNISDDSTNNEVRVGEYDEPLTELSAANIGTQINTTNKYITFTTSKKYLMVLLRVATDSSYTISDLMVSYSNEVLPYVLYGSNYINLVITNGVDTTNNLINLGNNFIGGIGDYKDKLTIDESGNVSLLKNIGKVVWDENITANYDSDRNTLFVSVTNKNVATTTDKKVMSDYFNGDYTTVSANQWTNYPNNSIGSRGGGTLIGVKASQFTSAYDFKTWLRTHNTTVYYVLETPTTIDLGTVDIELYKGANTITNSDNCNMVLKYY